MATKKKQKGGAGAEVIHHGVDGKALRAAQNDVKSLEYATQKAQAAVDHHSAVLADFQAQLEAAQARLAAVQGQ